MYIICIHACFYIFYLNLNVHNIQSYIRMHALLYSTAISIKLEKLHCVNEMGQATLTCMESPATRWQHSLPFDFMMFFPCCVQLCHQRLEHCYCVTIEQNPSMQFFNNIQICQISGFMHFFLTGNSYNRKRIACIAIVCKDALIVTISSGPLFVNSFSGASFVRCSNVGILVHEEEIVSNGRPLSRRCERQRAG